MGAFPVAVCVESGRAEVAAHAVRLAAVAASVAGLGGSAVGALIATADAVETSSTPPGEAIVRAAEIVGAEPQTLAGLLEWIDGVAGSPGWAIQILLDMLP